MRLGSTPSPTASTGPGDFVTNDRWKFRRVGIEPDAGEVIGEVHPGRAHRDLQLPRAGGGGSGRCCTCRTDGSPCLVMTTARIVLRPSGSVVEAGEYVVTPAGTHALESVGHPSVFQVKTAVLQEHPGTGALGLEAPSQGPRRREGIDEPVRRIDLEHLARFACRTRACRG